MKITLKITITTQYNLQVKFIDSQNKETIIKLTEDQEEYIPCISFETNIIQFCQNNDKSIHFLKQMFEHQDEFKLYTVHLQNKEYQLLPVSLFSLIVNEFKKKINNFEIENVLLEIPSNNHSFINRFVLSLESIGLKNIYVNKLTFDYSQQETQVNELIYNQYLLQKYQDLLDIQQQNTENEDKKNLLKEQHVFSTQERKKMTSYKIDPYCVFVASQYLNSIE